MDAALMKGLVVASVLLLMLMVLLVRRTVVATIAGFLWQRRVGLEQYVWVEERSSWGHTEASRNQRSKRETCFTNEIRFVPDPTQAVGEVPLSRQSRSVGGMLRLKRWEKRQHDPVELGWLLLDLLPIP